MRLVLCEADYWLEKNGYSEGLTITCLMRSQMEQWAYWKKGISPEERSVHEFGRGADTELVFPDALNDELLKFINEKHIYDPKRPAMKTVSKHGGTAMHNHWKVMDD